MKEMSPELEAYHENNRYVKQEMRAKRSAELKELKGEGFDVQMCTPYQFRVNGRLDIYPTRARWHDIATGKRGCFRGMTTKQFVREWFESGDD